MWSSWPSATAPSRTVAHVTVVLGIHSASYSSMVEATGDALLAGARCGACAANTLRLTGSSVRRHLVSVTGRTQLDVAVAKCSACGRRERVLPFDAIPGKRFGVDVMFPAVQRVVTDGKSVASVAREHGVTRRAVRQWVVGVGARALDLERLYHHRAQTAPRDAPAASLLVRWASVAVELVRPLSTPVVRFTTDLRLTARQECVEAARHLLALLDRWGGACAAAALGASEFRQAVLLFRSPTTTRQVPPEEFVPVPGSGYRDRNSGTASNLHGRVAPDGSPQRPDTQLAAGRAGEVKDGRQLAAPRRERSEASLTPPSTPLSGEQAPGRRSQCSQRFTGEHAPGSRSRCSQRFTGCESQRAWSPTSGAGTSGN